MVELAKSKKQLETQDKLEGLWKPIFLSIGIWKHLSYKKQCFLLVCETAVRNPEVPEISWKRNPITFPVSTLTK